MNPESSHTPLSNNGQSLLSGEVAQSFPASARATLQRDETNAGGPYQESPDRKGCVGVTMFDTPSSDDSLVLVLVPKPHIDKFPAQAVVRIKSLDDQRTYLGVVVRGPFALPDGLRPDAPPVVATALRGVNFLPEYHGLVEVEISGEEKNGQLQPHRFRPLPNSPVWTLNEDEVRGFMGTGGNVRLGRAIGHDDLEIAFKLDEKMVLPRHTAILGTTGGGKSTTVAGLIGQLQAAGAAVILLDTEGEYTTINEPTDNKKMGDILQDMGRQPAGVPNTHLHFLVGRACSNPQHPHPLPFSPRFSNLSPYTAIELFDFNDAQEERFRKALDVTVQALDELVWTDAERRAKVEMDEFETGYPQMRLSHLYDVACGIADKLEGKKGGSGLTIKSPEFAREPKKFQDLLDDSLKHGQSWRKVQGRIGRIERLNIFDNSHAAALDYKKMLEAGRVSIIDLSDSDSTLVNNLVISDLLRGVQKAQDEAYERAAVYGRAPVPVVIIIEEAHEFLSRERIRRMPILHQQVARIARRGRKRWLGLMFVTQLPQHLPDEILGLVNNFILHKIGDVNVISTLKRTIGGVDAGLWSRLPSLAPGHAVVSLASLTRPALTAIDPAPCALRMVD